jgi:hypothetical protein
MSEHTPKWFAGSDLGYGELNGTEIFDERYYVVAVTIGDVPSLDSKANAALIVRAVNSHAALRAALERASVALEMFAGSDSFIPSIKKQSADEAEHDAERRQMITRVAEEALEAARRALTEA